MLNQNQPKEVIKMSSPLEQVTVEQAAKELNIDTLALRDILEQGTFPFPLGCWVRHGERRAFWIYRGLLDQAKRRIAGDENWWEK